MTTAPAWLLAGFSRAVTHLGAISPAEEIQQLASDLATRWMTPERSFHNLDYLKLQLENIDFLAQTARNPAAIRVAAWFHGAVFDVSPTAVANSIAGFNAAASADFAATQLSVLGVPRPQTELVTNLILSLPDASGATDIDTQILSDVELSILGTDPEDYLEYLRELRCEYAHFNDQQYVELRSQLIGALLSRPLIFLTHGAAIWEEPARENLRAELERLQKTQTAGLSIPPADNSVSRKAASSDSEENLQPPLTPVLAPPEVPTQIDVLEEDEYSAPTDLASTLETIEDVMDTMVMKALKSPDQTLKPMSSKE